MQAKKIDERSAGPTRKFCTFYLAGRLYGVDILHVKEISSVVRFTPIYHAPREVMGFVNIRGQIHLVLDLQMLLGQEQEVEAEAGGRSLLVIFKPVVGESFGVLIDRIGDVVEIAEDEIEDRAASKSPAYLASIADAREDYAGKRMKSFSDLFPDV